MGWGNFERVWHIALHPRPQPLHRKCFEPCLSLGRGPLAFTAIRTDGGEAPHLSGNYEPVVIK